MHGQPRVEFLDHIRGLAILAVFVSHAVPPAFAFHNVPFQFDGWHRSWNVPWYDWLFVPPELAGGFGVAAFFIVSGFCIHLSYQSSATDRLRAFAIRRVFRIYPPYLIALIFLSFLYPWTWLYHSSPPGEGTAIFLSHLFLIHNLIPGLQNTLNPPFWSIGTEVQLYALYPLLFVFAGKFGWRATLLFTAIVEVGCRGWLIPYPEKLVFLTCAPFTTWFSWSLGTYMGEAYLSGKPLPFASPWGTPLWMIAGLAAEFFVPSLPFSFPCFALGVAHLVSWLFRHPEVIRPQSAFWKFVLDQLQFAGLVSYSAYLYHWPFVYRAYGVSKLIFHRDLPPLLLFTLTILSWPLFAWASYAAFKFIELPSIAFGKRLLARQRSASTAIANPNPL